MPQSLYQRKLLERVHPWQRWENQPAEGYSLADLDAAEIARTIDEAIRRGRMEEPASRNLHDLLVGLDLLQEGQLLKAAIGPEKRTQLVFLSKLLFGNCLGKFNELRPLFLASAPSKLNFRIETTDFHANSDSDGLSEPEFLVWMGH